MGRGTLIETDLTEEKKDSSENDQSNNDRGRPILLDCFG